ncbi:MAG: GDP-L-fucose synthase [Treponema sp.]|jgi:GDP-L-fucose synthase|nr:GDP-L-fucose synthase [Treponema sp.]
MIQSDKIYIAGHSGLVGSAIVRRLRSDGYTNLVTRTYRELDLVDQKAVYAFFEQERPEYVIFAAAKVGGIIANSTYPADFIYQNTMMGFNVINAAYNFNVKKLMNLGSTCIYPKMAEQPIKEEALLTGPLEPTNDAYALAKISIIKLCTAYNKQYGTNFLSVMPTNLYGIGDNYDLETSHVLPAMIRKFHEAKISNAHEVVLWGDGTPFREFLYSDDLAAAVIYLMTHCNASDLRNGAGDFINVGSGKELSIKELAQTVQSIVYENKPCQIRWDTAKPNGTPRKLCDISRLTALGFTAGTELRDGIIKAYKDFESNVL